MEPQLRTLDPRFLARWIRVTLGGWALGFVLVLVVIAVASVTGLGDTQFPVGLGMGAGVGLLQGRLIAPETSGRKKWLAASAFGMALPFVVSDLAGALGLELGYSLSLIIVFGGLITGLLQWRILRKQSAAAGWWILASTVGWSLAGSTVLINDRLRGTVVGLAGLFLFVAILMVGGVVLGGIGGVTLRRILRTLPAEV